MKKIIQISAILLSGMGLIHEAQADDDVAASVAILVQAVHNNAQAINNLTQNIQNGTIGITQQNTVNKVITIGKDTNGNEVNITGTAGDRVLTGLAAGTVSAGSTQAVNGGQLWQTDQKVANNSQAIINLQNGTTGMVQQDATSRVITVGKDTDGHEVNMAGTNGNRVLTGVADGQVAHGSTQAVNGGQLWQTDQQVASNTQSINNLTQNIQNGTIGMVQQDSVSKVITVGKDVGGTEINMAGTAGNRVITGVADGQVAQGSTQAVNGGQLFSLYQQIEYSNQSKYNALSNRIDKNRKLASQGVAAAMAMQIDMPEPEAGGFAGGVGFGTYDSESAMAVGVQYLTPSGRAKWSLAGSSGLSGHAHFGGKISVGFKF